MYSDDDMLMLSGIQHYRFCPRQWALIHIDQQWEDNRLTVEGTILHKHVNDPYYRQKCGDVISLRSVNIASKELGLYGLSDIIELRPTESLKDSITHLNYPGRWFPVPIEYKHGKPKNNEIDEVQLAAQVMCLEEMHNIHIPYATFFYAEIRQRIEIEITNRLRDIVKDCANDMHRIYASGIIPKCQKKDVCKKCSLLNQCFPKTKKTTTVASYLKGNLYECENS